MATNAAALGPLHQRRDHPRARTRVDDVYGNRRDPVIGCDCDDLASACWNNTCTARKRALTPPSTQVSDNTTTRDGRPLSHVGEVERNQGFHDRNGGVDAHGAHGQDADADVEGDDDDDDESVELDEDEYEIESIIGSRVNDDGDLEFRIKWKDYPPEDNTWEHFSNLNLFAVMFLRDPS